MKKLFLLPLSLIFYIVGFSQVWQNTLDGVPANLWFINSATNNPYLGDPGETVAANVSVTGIRRSNSLTGANALGAFGASGFTTSSSINTNHYFEFTLTPAPGHKLNFTSFTYIAGNGVLSSPPEQFAFRSSLDGFVNNIGAPNQGGTTITLGAPQFQNISGPITFRLYGYDADVSLLSKYWEIQSFSFNGTVALPVDFGSIEAVQQNNAVAVKWTTLKETNNSHFEIEASKDGKEFTTVKTVQSKNGNSDVAQEYEVSISASDVASLLGLPALLGLLSLGFTRRKRVLAGVAALVILGVNFIGCSKHGDAIDVNTIDKVFIRIKQVDKDGAFKYSDVIQVIRK